MEKSLKIEVPEGYMIDRENSTFENIIFKKIESPVIKWNKNARAVECQFDLENIHFMLWVEIPNLICDWDEAVKWIKTHNNLSLPTIKQLQFMHRYLDEINSLIPEGYSKLVCTHYWSEVSRENNAQTVSMYSGNIYDLTKKDDNYVRAVINL